VGNRPDREAEAVKRGATKGSGDDVQSYDGGWCIYALRCRNDYIYIGSTNNLERRLEEHRKGAGSKFVRTHLPFELVRVIPCEDSHTARTTEYRLKQLRRKKKLAALGLDAAERDCTILFTMQESMLKKKARRNSGIKK
jgi:putative endonuclease